MSIIRIISKKLKLTHVGQSETRDRYIYISHQLPFPFFLDGVPDGAELHFQDDAGELHNFQYTKGREHRLVRLGGYLDRHANVAADDFIIIKREDSKFYITHKFKNEETKHIDSEYVYLEY